MSPVAERDLIAEIASLTQDDARDLRKGIGDDCAVISRQDGMVELVTTDTLVSSVHFDQSWHPPRLLGRKAAMVNISDIAGMGGEPRFALLSLCLSPDCQKAWLNDFIDGFRQALALFNVVLVGGDTVAGSGGFMASVTLIGEMEASQVCYRDGAREGDQVWVSGYLGDAAAGLEICRRRLPVDSLESLVQAHLDPQPQVALGRDLAASGAVHAMMDLSDGLATDLAHICRASGMAAEIRGGDLPLRGELCRAADSLALSPLDLALKGGEDYQLVFTAAPEDQEIFQQIGRQRDVSLTRVGEIVGGEGVSLWADDQRIDITFSGYEHFS